MHCTILSVHPMDMLTVNSLGPYVAGGRSFRSENSLITVRCFRRKRRDSVYISQVNIGEKASSGTSLRMQQTDNKASPGCTGKNQNTDENVRNSFNLQGLFKLSCCYLLNFCYVVTHSFSDSMQWALCLYCESNFEQAVAPAVPPIGKTKVN